MMLTSKRTKTSERLPRVLCIVGPTASGKTDLAVALAKRFNGEIINADARQVYRMIEIGTSRPTGREKTIGGLKAHIHKGIPHYLFGFLHPEESYSAAEWREAALKAIASITKRQRLPIVVGGTGLYIASLVDNLSFPEVGAHPAFRKAYEEKPLDELVALLLMLDPETKGIVDLRNKRRVIRALEVATFTGRKFSELRAKGGPLVDALQIGIRRSPAELRERIDRTVDRMFEGGMVREVRDLLKAGVSPDAPALSAIGYRVVADYLKGNTTLSDAITKFKRLQWLYARRQTTWFKKDQRVTWVKNVDAASRIVGEWVMKSRE
jgi:tRNA dimethylallyltransferase